MKLTHKDRDFTLRLRDLLSDTELAIELGTYPYSRMILRKNYGDRIQSRFGMSRQGVRWRFRRVFNEMYVEAYMTILWIESTFGTSLRDMAIAIARERSAAVQREVKESNDMLQR